MPPKPLETTNMKSQMRKGVLELCVLRVIAQGEVYAHDILDALHAADLIVVEGTLYPLLSRLKNDGLVTYDWSESKSGPPRKYYSLTAEGRKTMEHMLDAWMDLDKSMNALLEKHTK